MIAAREHIRAQNVERNDRERSGDCRQQSVAIPGANAHDHVSTLGRRLPVHGRSERPCAVARNILEERPNQPQIIDNVGHLQRPKVIVRHQLELSFDFVGIFGPEFLKDCGLQAFALDLRFLVKRLLIDKILRRRVEELPNKRFLPIRPCLRTCPLAVGQREQHQLV